MTPSTSATSASPSPKPRPSASASCAKVAAAGLLIAAAVGCGESSKPSSTPQATATPTKTSSGSGGTSAPTKPDSGRYALQPIGSYESPVWAGVAPGDKRIFVVEKVGRIRIVGQSAPFLDISGQVSDGSEQGLLSMAFANDWTKSHRFYISFTNGDGDSRVVEYTGSATKANTGSARTVLAQDQPYSNHNGGLILMRPDNTMLVGFGDGGSSGDPDHRAQNMGTWLGKILRIDPRKQSNGKAYGVPANNPYVKESGAKPEILILGARNPWRFDFDSKTGDLWVGDVGQNKYEEVDDIPASKVSGANLGWSRYEGNSTYTSTSVSHSDRLINPVHVYSHDDGSCSITGGVVYRGKKLSKLVGTYLFTDICKEPLRGIDVASKKVRTVMSIGQQIVSFGVDSDGEVLTVNLGGEVSRIVAA